MSYMIGVCNSGNASDILLREYESDQDAIDAGRDEFCFDFKYVTGVYYAGLSLTKFDLGEYVKRDGWWFIDGVEQEE